MRASLMALPARLAKLARPARQAQPAWLARLARWALLPALAAVLLGGCAHVQVAERDGELRRAMDLLLETSEEDASVWPAEEGAAERPARPRHRWPRLHLHAVDLPLSQLVAALRELVPVDFLLDSGADAPFTASLRDLPLDRALGAVARSAGMALLSLPRGDSPHEGSLRGDSPHGDSPQGSGRPLFRLASADSLERARTALDSGAQAQAAAQDGGGNMRSFALSHGDSQQVAERLRGIFGQDLTLVADPRTNSLLARGAPETLRGLDWALHRLDRPRPLLYLEAWVLEADDDLASALGATLASQLGAGNVAGGLGGAGGGADGAPLGPDAAGPALVSGDVADAQLGVSLLDDARARLLRLTALARKGRSRILSHPRIFVVDGSTAEVFQGEEIPYVTQSGERGANTEFRQAGLRLRVTPRFLGAGLLAARIEVSKDSVDQGRDNPPISRREIRTEMRIPLGATLAIGGIRVRRSHRSRQGVLLGRAEGSHEDAQLIVLLRVTRADASGAAGPGQRP